MQPGPAHFSFRPVRHSISRRAGSVLIFALLITALIALVLGSYLSLNLGTARLAQRTFDRGAAFHLAEAGLEEGLWTYNRLLAGRGDAWQEWSVAGDAAWRRIEGFPLSPGSVGEIKLYASPIAPDEGTEPTLVALSSVRSASGAPVSQMIETTLRRRSYFAAGLVARERLVFRGRNTTFNSWDSDPDQDPATPAVPYAPGVASADGAVATGAAPSELSLNHARIHGTFISAGITPDVGSSGYIGPLGVGEGELDDDYLNRNFQADFPTISAPIDGEVITTFGPMIGTEGHATRWRAPSLNLKGSDTLTILGDVILTLTNPVQAISIGGQASLLVPLGSTLTIYAQGDVSIGGLGLANANPDPASVQFWSTAVPSDSSSGQDFDVRGNGRFAAVLYAPEAAVTVNGNGAIAGSIIARKITFTGNASFHYDLALGRLHRHAPFRSAGWRTVDDPAERAARLLLLAQ